MLGTVLLLILASFLPEPDGGALLTLYNLRSGLICFVLCVVGVVRACIRKKGAAPVKAVFKELDTDTLLLLFGLFMVIEGIRSAGVIDAAANLFYTVSGDNRVLAVYAHCVRFGDPFCVHRQHPLCCYDAARRAEHPPR